MKYPYAAGKICYLARELLREIANCDSTWTTQEEVNLFLFGQDFAAKNVIGGFWQFFIRLMNDLLKIAGEKNYRKIEPEIIEILESLLQSRQPKVIGQFKRHCQIVDNELVKKVLLEILEHLQSKYPHALLQENTPCLLQIV